jgi:hypothetical protein
LELGMFHYKMAVVCFAIGFCLKSEEKRWLFRRIPVDY